MTTNGANARQSCPRCGAEPEQPCRAIRSGAHLDGHHQERGAGPVDLLARGYLKYTLLAETDLQPLFLWRRRTQLPVVRVGYRTGT